MIENSVPKINNSSQESIEKGNFKKFLNTQLAFVDKAMELNNISREDALLEYSSIYRNTLRLPWPINKDNPVWCEFINQCLLSDDFAESAWEFVQKYKNDEIKQEQKKNFGPFRYKFDPIKKSVILHFRGGVRSIDPKQGSDLRENLKMLFDDVKENHPGAILVEGYSWLIKFLGRVFPKEFINSTVTEGGWFKSDAIWGQFITSSGFREKSAKKFLENVEKAKNNIDLQNAFPYQNLYGKCDIKYFYEFYS